MKIIRTFIKIAIASLFCIITMASCSELSLSETKLKFSEYNEMKSFIVRTDLNWWMAEQPEWVSIAKIEENGKTIVEVTPEKNHSLESRKGKIKIQTAEKYYIVDIFQDGIKLKKESGDLGLSVEWSTCNLGATKSTDFGSYYTWDKIHDYQNNEYRLPTREEQGELIRNCNCVWGEKNGVKGCYFVAKNGNYVFLPAAGILDGSDVYDIGSDGYYWSSSASVSSSGAGSLRFSSYGVGTHDCYRYDGLSVRLVRGKE